MTIKITKSMALFPSSEGVRKTEYVFEDGMLEFKKITIFLGANGSGKSTLALALHPLACPRLICINKGYWFLRLAATGFTTLKWPLPLGMYAELETGDKRYTNLWFRLGKDLAAYLGNADNVCKLMNEVKESILRELSSETNANKELTNIFTFAHALHCSANAGNDGETLYSLPLSAGNKNKLEDSVILMTYRNDTNSYCAIGKRITCVPPLEGCAYLSLFYGPHLPLIRNGIINLVFSFLKMLGKDDHEIEGEYWKAALGFPSGVRVSLIYKEDDPSFKVAIKIEESTRESVVPLWALGDGQRAALAQYVIFAAIRKAIGDSSLGVSNTDFLVVLDTPEAFMHVELMDQMTSNIVYEIRNKRNIHLIVVTQSLEYVQYLLSKYLTCKNNDKDFIVYIFEHRGGKVIVKGIEGKTLRDYIGLGIDLRLIKI